MDYRHLKNNPLTQRSFAAQKEI